MVGSGQGRGRFARALRAVAVGAVMLGLGCATAELTVRALNPRSRVQLVRDGANHVVLEVVQGVPIWTFENDPEALVDPDCVRTGDGLVVVLVGDSILHSWYATPDGGTAQLAVTLRRRLQAARPGSCVHNVARAGFTGAQQRIALARALETWSPDLVIWEAWKGEGHWVHLGDAWADVGPFALDAHGLPQLAVGPPAALNAWLAERSRAWRYLILTLGEERPTFHASVTDAYPTLPDAHRSVSEAGARFVVVMPSTLGRPFRDTLARTGDWNFVQAWAAPLGVQTIFLAEALADQDHLALRADPCCHFNAIGQEAVGSVLFEAIDWLQVPRAGSAGVGDAP